MPRSVRYEADGRPPELVEGPPLHLWLTYLTLAEGGAWPLPSLAEKRNVYWDADSLRLVNGSPMQAKEEEWLPATVAASAPVVPVEHRAVIPPLGSVAVRPASPEDVPTAPPDLRLAVVIDRSRSLATRAGEVEAALGQLQSLAGEGAAVDAYLTASPYRGEEPSRLPLEELDAGQIMYYGGQNAAALLAQFASLQGDSPYDAVFVVTDGSGYELGASQVEVPIPNAPVWIVHLGGDFPLGYDDETLQAIQASGGGVAGSIEEAFQRMLVARQASPAGSADLLGGYLWTVLPAEGAASGETEPSFAPLAARRLILSEIQRQREALGQVEALDQLHAIAVEHSLVTPYSSMIVLVDAAQLNSLLQLEKAGDRFEREYEPVGETNPVAPALTGVPEPHEWLLLALAGLILAWSVLKKKPLTALVLPRR
jgi:putative PEP-CTERM system integral membrane protein